MSCIFTGCRIAVLLEGCAPEMTRVYAADAHQASPCAYIFNLNPKSECTLQQAADIYGSIDFFLLLREGYYFWLASSPNILVIDMDMCYEITQKAQTAEEELETPDILWDNVMEAMRFQWLASINEYVYPTKKGGEKPEPPVDNPDVHPSAEQFTDDDPEPF
jgi:hypothetical protein